MKFTNVIINICSKSIACGVERYSTGSFSPFDGTRCAEVNSTKEGGERKIKYSERTERGTAYKVPEPVQLLIGGE
jgi:hypothetical protein